MWKLPEEMIRTELGSGEKLLWSGEPRQGIFLRGNDAFLIPFSLMWGGFAIFWEYSVVTTNAPPFFMLWGIPFVAIGLYMIVGRFWVDARQRANAAYGVTSERIVIITGLFSNQTKSLSIDTLTDISLTEKTGGIGTITFGQMPFWQTMYGNASWPGTGYRTVPQFELIPEARNVYETIRTAQRTAKLTAAAGSNIK
jgi:hypothetical protein